MPSPSSPKFCRNCGANDFYTQQISVGGYTKNLLPLGFFSAGLVQLRVCGSCGLVDCFVTGDSLEKVKQKFPRE